MATIAIDGQTIYYTRPMKTAGAPTLLLIHGAGGSHLGWPKQIQRLPGSNCYNLDLPGHGRSPGPGRSTIAGYADVLQTFIAAKEMQQVVPIGHSMGGAIAQTLALRGLPQITNLVLLNTGARLKVAPFILDAAVSEPGRVANFIIRMSWPEDAPEELLKLSEQNIMQIDPLVLRGDFLACNSFDVRTDLPNLRVPTLVISGTEDKMTPLKFGRFLADNIPVARFVPIKGAGHFTILERPAAVARAISDFLELHYA